MTNKPSDYDKIIIKKIISDLPILGYPEAHKIWGKEKWPFLPCTNFWALDKMTETDPLW